MCKFLLGFFVASAVWLAWHGNAQETWLVGNGLVRHLKGGDHCNNTFTPGMGLEFGNTAIGWYDNSNCRTSFYLAQAWTPLRYGPLRAGLLGGVVSGYSAPLLPVAALTASLEGEKYGVNLVLIPPSGESGKGGIVWLQWKTKW